MNFFNLKKWKKDDYINFFIRVKNKEFLSLSGKTYVLLFLETSTRTHYSFIKAIQDLGGNILNFNYTNSSAHKGESFYNTIKTLESLDTNGIIIRSPLEKYWNYLKDIKIPIINAGDGSGSHPTQALLDLYTAFKHFNRFNLNILIMGDIKHSRVAKSNICAWRIVGSNVDITGPEEFKIKDKQWINRNKIDLTKYDVVILLRIQKERLKKIFINHNYNKQFGLNGNNIKLMKNDSIILHPGPFNLNLEITQEVLENSKCKVWEQVRNGLAIRKMVLTISAEKK